MKREELINVGYRCLNGNLATDVDTCLEADLLYVLGDERAVGFVKRNADALSQVLSDYQENKAVNAAAAQGASPDDQGIHAMMSVVWPRWAQNYKRPDKSSWESQPYTKQQVFVRQAREILRYIEETVKKRSNGRAENFQERDPEKCGHPGHKEKLSEGLYRCENCGAKLRSETEPGTHGRREWWVLVKE